MKLDFRGNFGIRDKKRIELEKKRFFLFWIISFSIGFKPLFGVNGRIFPYFFLF
jgi:hypothetical protein